MLTEDFVIKLKDGSEVVCFMDNFKHPKFIYKNRTGDILSYTIRSTFDEIRLVSLTGTYRENGNLIFYSFNDGLLVPIAQK